MLPNLGICRQIWAQQNKASYEIYVYPFFIYFNFVFWSKNEGFISDSGGVTNADWALEPRRYSGIYGLL